VVLRYRESTEVIACVVEVRASAMSVTVETDVEEGVVLTFQAYRVVRHRSFPSVPPGGRTLVEPLVVSQAQFSFQPMPRLT
jgi:hypothetical protein